MHYDVTQISTYTPSTLESLVLVDGAPNAHSQMNVISIKDFNSVVYYAIIERSTY